MAPSPRATDLHSFGVVYAMVAFITLWAGFRMIDHGLASHFFRNYLLQWEVTVQAYSARQGSWPEFTGSNHVDYMNRLTQAMKTAGVQLPKSNTEVMFRYQISSFGAGKETIFVLCFHNRLVMYGLTRKMIDRIDRYVDHHVDLKRGRVTGYTGKSAKTYIGMWRL
jgi:hypothetical protein